MAKFRHYPPRCALLKSPSFAVPGELSIAYRAEREREREIVTGEKKAVSAANDRNSRTVCEPCDERFFAFVQAELIETRRDDSFNELTRIILPRIIPLTPLPSCNDHHHRPDGFRSSRSCRATNR